ncbi:hypothetical protein LSTR_LSTR007175 [Laodelphax striatellus]|uniref:Armadillo repeat-containing domain-containing protein n=1 Tax=Laodelphax striatellus TaxID=195883 RepID=A0A482WWD5_LAOST|nr:hypothetical protein LSTR_LSTR007175 [Laodelphax striatellus]
MSGGREDVGGPRVVIVREPDDDSESSAEEGSSEEETEVPGLAPRNPDAAQDYWQIQKLIKYMKAGNQTATVVALACLKDHELGSESIQTAIKEIGGLEVLINLLETNDFKCKMGALSVLSVVSENFEIRRHMTDLGCVPLLVNLLNDPSRALQAVSATTLSNVAKIKKARKIVRKCDGLPQLCAEDPKTRELVRQHGGLDPLVAILRDEGVRQNKPLLAAVTGAIWKCSISIENVRRLDDLNTVNTLVQLLNDEDEEVIR